MNRLGHLAVGREVKLKPVHTSALMNNSGNLRVHPNEHAPGEWLKIRENEHLDTVQPINKSRVYVYSSVNSKYFAYIIIYMVGCVRLWKNIHILLSFDFPTHAIITEYSLHSIKFLSLVSPEHCGPV